MKSNILLIFIVVAFFTSCSNSQKSNVVFTEVSNFKEKTYSVYVENFKDDSNVWSDMEEWAKQKVKGSYTSVLFFDNKKFTPYFLSDSEFPESYNQYCVAGFWHYPNGSEEFKKYPMK